ncbi:MAG: hypothetical protein Q9163_000989 [Psora crenata]
MQSSNEGVGNPQMLQQAKRRKKNNGGSGASETETLGTEEAQIEEVGTLADLAATVKNPGPVKLTERACRDERINAAKEWLRGNQTSRAGPQSTQQAAYPFMEKAIEFEDQYLVVATLEGLSYSAISQHLSQSGRQWSENKCRQRVRALTNNRLGGGSVLPGSWEDPDRGVPDVDGSYLNTLFEDEYHELALYASRKQTLFTQRVFRNHMTAARLRACLKEMEAFSEKKQALFQVEIQQHGSEDATRQRRQHAKEKYAQRIENLKKWTPCSNAEGTT